MRRPEADAGFQGRRSINDEGRMAMKKVRYAVGAVGAVPALGLMVPAANAATAVTHAPGSPGKTVWLRHREIPLVNCNASHIKAGDSNRDELSANIAYAGQCVHFQGANLNHSQKGLTERTRFYSGGGRLEHTTWQAGRIYRGLTSWASNPNIYAHEVCQALVANTNHNDVKYGPICETT
jgi:hypothetical protein